MNLRRSERLINTKRKIDDGDKQEILLKKVAKIAEIEIQINTSDMQSVINKICSSSAEDSTVDKGLKLISTSIPEKKQKPGPRRMPRELIYEICKCVPVKANPEIVVSSYLTSEYIRPRVVKYKENKKRREEERIESVKRCLAHILHSCQCRDGDCNEDSCSKMKRVIHHARFCPNRSTMPIACPVCRQLIALCCYHAKECIVVNCIIPFCLSFRQQMEARRRADAQQQAKENQEAQ